MLTKSLISILFVTTTLYGRSALGEPRWGINISEDPAVCELKIPIEESKRPDNIGSLWIGFYWLAEEAVVPGHVIPNGEVLVMVRASADYASPFEYVEPSTAHISDIPTKKYKFDDYAVSTSYFFLEGVDSRKIFELARQSEVIEISFGYEEIGANKASVAAGENTDFHVYAEMLETCGREIAS